MHIENNMVLEELLDKKYPHASFHDALLNNLHLDYLSRTAEFHMELCVGDPDDPDIEKREAHAKGILTFNDFLFCILEPPDQSYDFRNPGGLWITNDGPIASLKDNKLSDLSNTIPEKAVAHYFFNSDWNSFIYIAAMGVEFQWL